MTELEMLDIVADTVEAKSDEERLHVLACLSMAEQKIINRMYPFVVPEDAHVPKRFEGVQMQIAAYLYNKRGAEGETSRSENGVSRVFGGADVPEAMLRDITPMGMVL